MNADESPATLARFAVRAIPHLVLLRDGQVAEQIVGAVPRGRLVKAIDAVLA